MKNIRNFCIIAHIDHGKSTLADRFLEITGTVPKQKMRPQMLDQMELERERGITIKLQPVRMNYKGYVLNLIDTPGHMDFYYEVMRSLEAVEGAILLVDAVKGVQAQTLSNLHLAQKQNLKIIPVINKIDLPNARIEEVEQEIKKLLNTDKIIKISAKFGTNVEQILEEIINHCPAPKTNQKDMLVFDAFYDSYKGVVAYIRAFKPIQGAVGVLTPKTRETGVLNPGEIGYLETGEKNLENYLTKIGWQTPQSMVFASIYPARDDDFNFLKSSLHKLKLNDAALFFQEESSSALGRGFRCGFLGMLHLEIIIERLRREYNLELVVTTPQVEHQGNSEPWVKLHIITPKKYLGQIMNLFKTTRGEYKDTRYLEDILNIEYEVALADIIVDFYDNLKSASAGFASMSYQLIGYRPGDLVKLEVLIAHQTVKELEQIVPREFALAKAKDLAEKLKEIVPKQNFAVAIQVALDGRIVARQTISALKKDVTGYLYGGDYTRKMKLWQKQKKGKKKLEKIGKVNLPSEVFVKLLKK